MDGGGVLMRKIHKFGRNPDVGNNTWEDVHGPGGTYPWPTAAGLITIRSSTGGDTSTGAGARSVTIAGLSTSWEDLQETLLTNGTALRTSTNKFIRVNRAYVNTAGTYSQLLSGGNLGTISIRTTTSSLLAQIGISTGTGTVGLGQTQMTHYTVPAGWTAYVRDIQISAKASKSVDVIFLQRQNADDTTAPLSAKRLIDYYDGLNTFVQFDHGPTPLGPFPEKTDLWWAAKGDGVSSAVSVNYGINLWPKGQTPEFS